MLKVLLRQIRCKNCLQSNRILALMLEAPSAATAILIPDQRKLWTQVLNNNRRPRPAHSLLLQKRMPNPQLRKLPVLHQQKADLKLVLLTETSNLMPQISARFLKIVTRESIKADTSHQIATLVILTNQSTWVTKHFKIIIRVETWIRVLEVRPICTTGLWLRKVDLMAALCSTKSAISSKAVIM